MTSIPNSFARAMGSTSVIPESTVTISCTPFLLIFQFPRCSSHTLLHGDVEYNFQSSHRIFSRSHGAVPRPVCHRNHSRSHTAIFSPLTIARANRSAVLLHINHQKWVVQVQVVGGIQKFLCRFFCHYAAARKQRRGEVVVVREFCAQNISQRIVQWKHVSTIVYSNDGKLYFLQNSEWRNSGAQGL